MRRPSDDTTGMILAAAGVVALSPDSLLIRMIDLDLWTLACLRGIFMVAFLSVIIAWTSRGEGLAAQFRFDPPAWGMAATMTIGIISFVAAIQTTSVAHTLIIVGTIPIITAVLGLLLLGEAIAPSTRITGIVVFACLFIVVQDDTASSLEGDFYAVIASVAMALNFVLARKTRVRNRLATVFLGSLSIALFCLPFADLTVPDSSQWQLSALLGLFVSLSYALMMLAPRYIPAAEVAIFLPLETVLGITWVWLFLHEQPSLASIIGGSGIVIAIMINSTIKLRTTRQRMP